MQLAIGVKSIFYGRFSTPVIFSDFGYDTFAWTANLETSHPCDGGP